MIIGLCGKSGSGKSTISKYLLEKYKDAIHLDIDSIGHYVLTLDEVKNELVNVFGSRLLEDGQVNRKILGSIVFNSKTAMDILTDITWKYMEMQIDWVINNNPGKVIILDWQLLPKTKFMGMCDLKILLDIPYEVRKERCIIRDGITEEAFDLRDANSVDYMYEDFDYVLEDNTLEYLEKKVRVL